MKGRVLWREKNPLALRSRSRTLALPFRQTGANHMISVNLQQGSQHNVKEAAASVPTGSVIAALNGANEKHRALYSQLDQLAARLAPVLRPVSQSAKGAPGSGSSEPKSEPAPLVYAVSSLDADIGASLYLVNSLLDRLEV
jgi:hypothetical protein